MAIYYLQQRFIMKSFKKKNVAFAELTAPCKVIEGEENSGSNWTIYLL